ncbi:putative myosin-binding protein [Helianthus annuus]|uniref:GTD-binding domain-containing protein n=1 Tax=Helianthus annuus TaxID=4232 RepID=A0A251U3W1_HELAN|nr:putative myosin-binding protein [Helianthus annuus]KAJ0552271.1 putative myosin-binding protein [Helianthus annuus]KAJ0721202.1 putative myosin-binding protein [Helianthus annuus]KAJ0896356.1 putative myosin-binding protein [Helianthus annuus]KAJ0900334.1 putative myosin-binding protein [Helianthus annuus]
MAANRFATMVHNNTNKITLVLTYVVLEWTLIILLFLNSIFSYFIIKFARFFGLKPPCIWCTQLDRFFEPQHKKNSHRDLLCEFHSKEVSELKFCSKHEKLAESHDLCSNCSSGFGEKPKKFVFSKVEKIDHEVCLKCSCCDVEFNKKRFDDASCFVINPSVTDLIGSDSVSDNFGGKYEHQKQGKETEETEETGETEVELSKKEDSNIEKPTQDLEFLLDYSGKQLVQVELIDPATENFHNSLEVDEDQEFGEFQKAEIMSESKTEDLLETQETHFVLEVVGKELLSVTAKTEDSSKFAELDSMEFEETENSLVFHVNLSHSVSESTQTPSDVNAKEVEETEEVKLEDEEAEVSIGTEIPVLDSCDEKKAHENFNLHSSTREEPSTSSHDLDLDLDLDFSLEYGMIERKESMVDESCDGSEMDGGDPIDTTEKLKSALRDERKALQALYAELEEERSASAVAASETMAMINRLQEEKAAMQMEALHYQRMMEEQSEYDQEALQLLNEVMVKKDKELELYRKKVLDYEAKERVRLSTSSVKSVTCSGSCSHSEDGDGMWVDVNHESKEEGITNGNQESRNQNTPVDTILNPDSSFVDFEDERLSILEQLKVLEEKLFTLSDEEDRHFSEFKQIDDFFEENGKHLNGDYDYDAQEVNGIANGFLNESHEIHYQDHRAIGSTGKRPFPLIDTLETENNGGVITSNGNGNGFHSAKVENTAVTIFELQKRRIDIEEEVDQLYVRLQALEADREFLKHCFGSLKKGDKGMKLLQEILQHLRDLKNIDLREKSSAEV